MSIYYRDSGTLFMTEDSTVVRNKIVNSNFYSYTICRIVEIIAIVLMSIRTDYNTTEMQR